MFQKLIKDCKLSFPRAPKKYILTLNKRSLEMRWSLAVVLVAGLGLLMGCGGGSAKQYMAAQSALQRQPSNPNKGIQQQITVQALQPSQVDYKDYQVGPEDLLTIEILGQEKLKRELRVNGQGEIAMPLVGVVKVAGMTPQQIEKRLMELYDASYLVNPQVTVAVKEFRHQRVAVTGAVDKPGAYELIGPRTLLEVLSMAGGISNRPEQQAGDVIDVIRPKADLARTAQAKPVQPFTPQTDTTVIDLRRLVKGQSPELNIMIRSGDVVHVPFSGTAFIMGAVHKPGQIPVKENLTVSQAVALAGGIDPIMGGPKITVMRFGENGQPLNIDTNLKNILARTESDIPIKDNDVIMVNVSGIKQKLSVIRALLPIPSGSYGIGY
jgi:polysaccharide biosynthesis/export protein